MTATVNGVISWPSILDCSDKGPRPNVTNAVRVLQHDPALGPETIWRDEFLDRVFVKNSAAREWRDDDDTRLAVYMQDHTGLVNIQERTVASAVRLVARQRSKHCVREWLTSLSWDRVPRISTAFEDHWGADGTAYTRSASRNFFIGMAARILKPGCKLDTMPVFEGPQGIKKSSALQVLGGAWYSVAHESVSSKDFLQGLRGRWLVEIAELQSFTRAEVNAVKTMMSNPCDDYRPSYGRNVVSFPRQCVFAGTTNADDWGDDATGLRRFWPITCGDIQLGTLRAARDQLFAEATASVLANETWWEMPDTTAGIQASRQFHDEWTAPILDWCAIQPTDDGVTIRAVLLNAIKLTEDRIDKRAQMRVANVLKQARWQRKDARIGDRIAKVWRKEDTF